MSSAAAPREYRCTPRSSPRPPPESSPSEHPSAAASGMLKLLKLPSFDKWEGYYLDDERSIKIDKSIGKDICVMIHANVLPTKSLVSKIKKLQLGEFLSVGEEGAVAYKFSQKEVADSHKIKISTAVQHEEDLKVLHYPWQIFQLND